MKTLHPKLPIDKYKGKEYSLKLGQVYEITTIGGSCAKVLFIQTSAKGFNFLHLRSAKCVHRSPLYQVNSAQKGVGRLQRNFDMAIPDHVIGIKELSQEEILKIRFLDGISFYAPTKTKKEQATEEKIRKLEAEEQAIEDHRIINNLSGMEIE